MLTLRSSFTATLAVCAVTSTSLGSASAQQSGRIGERESGFSQTPLNASIVLSAVSWDAAAHRNVQDTANLITTLKNSANYKTMVELLDLAGLTPTLQGSAQFTVFAPTDAAFAELPQGKLDELKRDTAALKKVLLYHIISSSISANQVVKLKTARTVDGPRVEFMMKDGQLMINNAAIVQPDIKASNGVIHGISKVLMK